MSATVIFAVLAAAAAAAFVVVLLQGRATAARLAELEAAAKERDEERRAALEKEKKSVKLLEERTEELGEMKKELGALKKKQFAREEEWKKKHDELAQKLEDRERDLAAKPAFGEPEAPRPTKPRIETKVVVREEPKPAPAPAPVDGDKRVEELTNEKREMAARLAELSAELKSVQGDVRKAKRRVENYRRIDTINKSKLELLADKLSQMGRAYYDVVSELAALKGEVNPKPSKMADEARAQAEAVQAELARDRAEDEADEARTSATP